MKVKILLTVLFLIGIAATSVVQINKGQYLLDGGVYFDNTTSPRGSTYYADNTRDFSVNIRLREVVKTNSVVGLIASYSNYNSHQPGFADSNYNRINQFTGGAFCRRYKKVLKDFYFFGELEGVFSHLNERYGSSNFPSSGTTTSNGGTVSLRPEYPIQFVRSCRWTCCCPISWPRPIPTRAYIKRTGCLQYQALGNQMILVSMEI